MRSLNCSCGNRLDLKLVELKVDDYLLKDVPEFLCPNCGNRQLPPIIREIIDYLVAQLTMDKCEKKTGDFLEVAKLIWSRGFIEMTKLPFKICMEDYYSFPGLFRSQNEGFLTPIYFNIEVLLKYSYHPEYQLELGANSYGTILKEDSVNIQFGINENNRVIMWYGDICKLPVEEQYYLLSENIESDHSISSEFYEAQIEIEWAQPSDTNQIFINRSILEKEVFEAEKCKIFQLELETLKIIKNIKPFIVSSDENFISIISSLNMILVESLDVKVIKSFLQKKHTKKELKGLGGLKLFEKWIISCLACDDGSDVVCPMYVLYDLRVFCSHLQSNETGIQILESANVRLNLDASNRDYQLITKSLVNELNIMLVRITTEYKKQLSSHCNIEVNKSVED